MGAMLAINVHHQLISAYNHIVTILARYVHIILRMPALLSLVFDGRSTLNFLTLKKDSFK